MIVQPLVISKYILQVEALNRRLILNHPIKDIVNSQARILRAGYNGEAALQFPLSFLPYDDFLIFHHLRIPDAHGFFQIDILLLSKEFLLIIEVKNIDGEVSFDDIGQSIRRKEGKEDSFTNPIEQINLQHIRLLRWLRNYNLPTIPIEKIAVYSSRHTILKDLTNDKAISNTVIRKDKILSKIEEIKQKHPIPVLTEDQLMELSYKLLSAHTEESIDALEKFKVSPEELITGVICPECGEVPMIRKSGKWNCIHCKTISKTAHKQDLRDYALLICEYISNKNAREFLQLPSTNTARNLLKGNYRQIGDTSGRKYHLVEEIFE
ncbi:nuclease-related domain-containing protein [Oceanobacillus sp. CF4.6]|uniref:nuclease-related domain-containing protein n=1 Tax=Oceanobacillus sp. CF4.6 TaxID=3373080 RepID=UPI003EE5796F